MRIDAFNPSEPNLPIPSPSFDKNETWVQEYTEQFGQEPSFF